jgi:hypothetical protein
VRKLASILILVATVPALAQKGSTVDMTGYVSSGGQRLSGVTVTLRSESLQGSRVTTTGANGGFLIPFLPPGTYEADFELDGFTAVRKIVPVSLATTARLDVDLQPATVRESITVGDRAPVATDVSIATNLRAAAIDRLPVRRDLRSIALLSPGASMARALMIGGAPSWDSLFLVNGMVVNEYQTNQPHVVIFEDAVEEVVVLSGGIPAEYGRFTGGVVSAITKTGGNELHGALRDRISNDAWQALTPWPGHARPRSQANHALEGTLGGYLRRDRVWFFVAARDARSSSSRFTSLTNVSYEVDAVDRRAEAKLTARLSPHVSLIGSFLTSSVKETNVTSARTDGVVLETSALIPERVQPLRLMALTANAVMHGQWFMEGHASAAHTALQGNGGRSRDRVPGTLVQVRNAGLNAPFGCGICGDDERNSTSWYAKVSHYRNTSLGNHTFLAGADGFEEERRNRGTRTSSEFFVQTGAARIVGNIAFPIFASGTSISWTPHYDGERGHDLGTNGAFISDRWEIEPRIALNLGLRYDRNRARDALGHLISNDGAISPRLGAVWDVTGASRHRLLASYGRYGAKLLEGGGSPQQVGVFNQLVWRYGGPEINALSAPVDQLVSSREALERLFSWFDLVGGVSNRSFLMAASTPESSGQFDGALRSPAVDEGTLGYSLSLASGWFRIDAINRRWKHLYAAQADMTTGQRVFPFAGNLDVVRIVNDDETVRTYRALQMQGAWHRGALRTGGGYTLSALRGNDDAEEGLTASAPRNWPLALWYPEYYGYPQRRPVGYLRHDQRHRARGWIMWDLPLWQFSLLQRFDSGTPYSVVADIDPTGRSTPFADRPANPGYVLSHAVIVPYFFSARGAFRTDDVWSTDVSVGLSMNGRYRPLLRFDVYNVFNRAAVVAPSTAVLTRQRAGAASGLLAFNPFTETPVEGVHFVRAADFGKPTGPESYQPPRRYELSVGLRF